MAGREESRSPTLELASHRPTRLMIASHDLLRPGLQSAGPGSLNRTRATNSTLPRFFACLKIANVESRIELDGNVISD